MSISSAYVHVECNNCFGASEEIELTSLAGRGQWDERNVNRHLEREGWKIVSDNEHLCPACTSKSVEEQ